MGLLVLCSSLKETEKILEALFDIILSKYDGMINNTDNWTPCYKAKIYLKSLMTTSVLNILEADGNESNNDELNLNEIMNEDDVLNYNLHVMNFKSWAQSIADRSRAKVDSIIGMTDYAQYLVALEPFIVKTFKLFPCQSAIMKNKFGCGEETASSCRIESNFNHIKNRLSKMTICL